MPLKGQAFFSDAKRKSGQNTQTYNHSAKSHGNFYTSPCIFTVFKNFQIRFMLHAKIKVFYINVKVT